MFICVFFFFKQKTAYEMRISDWSSDVCSSDLQPVEAGRRRIEDGVAVRARYLAAFGTMTLAGGAEFSVDFETDFAAQTGTSKRRCHRGPSFPVCGAFIPAPASARDNAQIGRDHV